jgi:HEAT repeat protein
LFNIAHVEGKRDPLLVRALRDKDQRRRAAAAAALGEDGGDYARRPGRRVIPRPFKIATKAVRYVDGKKEAEIEHSEFQFFNAFEDKVFAKP